MSMFNPSTTILRLVLVTGLLSPLFVESVESVESADSTRDALAGGLNASLSLAHEPRRGQPVVTYQNTIVSRDGEGLPVGSGSARQGKQIYAARCAACHGVDGAQPGNALVGGQGSLATPSPQKTVGSYWPYATTLYDYIARAMPYGQEKVLHVDEVYAVVAYVLHLNQIVEADTRLDQQSLPQVVMPNRAGFVELQPK
ncbi:MAG: cytochrome c5 [Candidatus Azotimanducaceae bacterium]|jgi:cytochrome c5